jgi:hypothetical protein
MRKRHFIQSRFDQEFAAKLTETPFLLAAIEDALAAQELSMGSAPKGRHLVTLMHDAIEFVLYEVLVSDEVDIYESGQSTIGLNEALRKYAAEYGEPPLIASIRTIQKHRGDAKHHGQVPDQGAMGRMQADFPVLMSRLVFRHFGQLLTELNLVEHFLPLHVAMFYSYRKHRNRNWNKAVVAALSCLLHGVRSRFGTVDDFGAASVLDPGQLVALVVAEISKPQIAAQLNRAGSAFAESLASLESASAAGDLRSMAEVAASMFELFDKTEPSLFVAETATFLTPRLAMPKTFRYRSMSWAKWWGGDSDVARQAGKELAAFLPTQPRLVERLGTPEYDDDGDRYWKWWELAVYDGEEWQSIHLNDRFEVSTEHGAYGDEPSTRRERAMIVTLEQFRLAGQALMSNREDG